LIAEAIRSGDWTSSLCFVIGIVMPVTSASWKASDPIAARATCPVMARIGIESMCASASPVTRLVAAGPDVTMQTPTSPVAWA
jgi:hypothetical protein